MNRDMWEDIDCAFYRYGFIAFFGLSFYKIFVKILTW